MPCIWRLSFIQTTVAQGIAVTRYRLPPGVDRRPVSSDRQVLSVDDPAGNGGARAPRAAPYDELKEQVRRIAAAGLRPTHLDTHKHTHLAPPVLDAVARLGEEFGIRWVRRPFDFPLNCCAGRCRV